MYRIQLKVFPLSNNLLSKMHKLWTYQVKFKDQSSWTEWDQVHCFGCRLNSPETRENERVERGRTAVASGGRGGVGRRLHCGDGVGCSGLRPERVPPLFRRCAISFNPQIPRPAHSYRCTTLLLTNYLAPGPTTSKGWSWDLNEHLFHSKIHVLTHYVILPSLTF